MTPNISITLNTQHVTIERYSEMTDWEYLAEHRGETVWNVKTGATQEITLSGEYPSDTTLYELASPHDKWNG